MSRMNLRKSLDESVFIKPVVIEEHHQQPVKKDIKSRNQLI